MIQKRNISVIIVVLLVGQGAVAVTGLNQRLTQQLKQIQESQPGLEEALAKMSEKERRAWYDQLIEQCGDDLVIREYIKEKGLDRTPEFIKQREQVLEAVERNLYAQVFQEDVSREVIEEVKKMSDTDLRAYYDENRDKNPYFDRPPFFFGKGKGKERKPSAYASFEDVRKQVKQVLKQIRFNEAMKQKIEQLKKKYSAKIKAYCVN